MLSIIATTLEGQPDSSFTLVYGNQRINTIMFNEALQDLKDRYPARLSLIHLLSRQAQELELLNGRIDEAKWLNCCAPSCRPARSMKLSFAARRA